jgi:hypothetical protein
MSLAIGLIFNIFVLKTMGRSHGPCEYFFCKVPMTPFHFYAFKIGVSFALKFHLHFTSISIMTF